MCVIIGTRKLLSQSKWAFRPLLFHTWITRRLGLTLQRNEQQDVHEVLKSILQSDSPPASPRNQGEFLPQLWGRTMSTIICNVCDTTASTYEEFSDLSITLQESIHQSIVCYFAKEELTDYACECCQAQDSASIVRSVVQWPEILTIHMIRFNKHQRKTHDEVLLDRNLELSGIHYELVSIINHKGNNLAGGHFFTTRLISPQCTVTYDDDRVSYEDTPMWSSNAIQSSQAYLLFYKQIYDF